MKCTLWVDYPSINFYLLVISRYWKLGVGSECPFFGEMTTRARGNCKKEGPVKREASVCSVLSNCSLLCSIQCKSSLLCSLLIVGWPTMPREIQLFWRCPGGRSLGPPARPLSGAAPTSPGKSKHSWTEKISPQQQCCAFSNQVWCRALCHYWLHTQFRAFWNQLCCFSHSIVSFFHCVIQLLNGCVPQQRNRLKNNKGHHHNFQRPQSLQSLQRQ